MIHTAVSHSEQRCHCSFLTPPRQVFCITDQQKDANNHVSVHSVRFFLHSGIDAASVELNLSFSQYRCRPCLASQHLLSVCLLFFLCYNMKLSPARSAKTGKRWREVDIVSLKKKAKGCWWQKCPEKNHIYTFLDIFTLCKLIFYNVYVRTLNQKNAFFSICGLLVLGKESFIPKKKRKRKNVGCKESFSGHDVKKISSVPERSISCLLYFPQCYHLFTEIKTKL